MKTNKLGNFFLGILPLFIGILVQFIVSILGMLFYFLLHGRSLILARENGTFETYLYELSLSFVEDWTVQLSAACGAVMLLICFFWFRHLTKTEERIAFQKAFSFQRVIGLVLLAFGFQVVINLILGFLQIIVPELFKTFEELMKLLDNQKVTILSFVYAVILGPISEEFFFRGVCMTHLKRSVPVWAAVVIQAFLFGVYHMNLIQGLYAFLVGLMLGYIMERTKSIYCPILFHIAFNFSSYLLSWILTEEMAALPVVNFIFLAAGAASLVVGFVVFQMTLRQKSETSL